MATLSFLVRMGRVGESVTINSKPTLASSGPVSVLNLTG